MRRLPKYCELSDRFKLVSVSGELPELTPQIVGATRREQQRG
jgi:hypothetical protein